MTPEPPNPRFRFRLSTLLQLNVLFAVVMGLIRFATSELPTIAVLVSPIVWICGALGVVVMTAMGDAFGRATGGLAGAVIGAALWVGTLILCSVHDEAELFSNQWPAHLTAASLTLLGTIVLGVQQARAERIVDTEVGATAAQLLANKRHRGTNE